MVVWVAPFAVPVMVTVYVPAWVPCVLPPPLVPLQPTTCSTRKRMIPARGRDTAQR